GVRAEDRRNHPRLRFAPVRHPRPRPALLPLQDSNHRPRPRGPRPVLLLRALRPPGRDRRGRRPRPRPRRCASLTACTGVTPAPRARCGPAHPRPSWRGGTSSMSGRLSAGSATPAHCYEHVSAMSRLRGHVQYGVAPHWRYTPVAYSRSPRSGQWSLSNPGIWSSDSRVTFTTKRFLASSTVIADHGSANSLFPIPMKPPNDITAYATRPVVTSTISSSIRPISCPARLTTLSWISDVAPSVLRNFIMTGLLSSSTAIRVPSVAVVSRISHARVTCASRNTVMLATCSQPPNRPA